MVKMKDELIKDEAETKRKKYHKLRNIVGIIFEVLGLSVILLKGLSAEYIDETGLLHESFFLLPMGFLFILVGIIIVVIDLMYYYGKSNYKYSVLSRIGYIFLIISSAMALLIYSNGNRISVLAIVSAMIGVGLIICSKLKNIKKNRHDTV